MVKLRERSSMNYKKSILILPVILVGLIVGYFIVNENEVECLNNNLVATFQIKHIPESLEHVIINVPGSNDFSKLIYKDVSRNYHPVELHKCHFYLIREFNYKFSTKQDPGYASELWQYNYKGVGEKLLQFTNVGDSGKKNFYFTRDFRVDPSEKFIVLEIGYGGDESNLIVIKSLKSLSNPFTISLAEIERINPKVIGNFGFGEWSKNGRYFWGEVFQAAYTIGFIRVDTKNWSYEVFAAPENTMGGDKLNPNNGYITYSPQSFWSGVAEVDEEERERRRVEGVRSQMFVHNLLTGKDTLVVEDEDPLWFFRPKWLSDTELQYTLPSGETKTFTIPNG